MRTIFLFRRAAAAIATNPALTANYPADLSAALGEVVLYDAGAGSRFPLLVRAGRGAGGVTSVVKLQAAALPPDGANFASRGPGGQQGLLQVFGVSGDLYTVQLEQRVGISQALDLVPSGTIGLDRHLLVRLPTNSSGSPSGTPQLVAIGINGLGGADFIAIASGAGASSSLLGPAWDRRPAAAIRWADIASEVAGTVATEHTITAPAGGAIDVSLIALAKGQLAVRALAKTSGAPADAEFVSVLAAVEGL